MAEVMADVTSDRGADVVVIGAGVIGASIAYELAARGRRTVSVDALSAAGFGSTSSSSAIVRFNYSTPSGVAMAWEGLHYWRAWPEHLRVGDERGVATLVPCGMLALDVPGGHRDTVPLFDQVGVPYEVWDTEELRARMPGLDPRVLGPPVPVDDEAFWAEPYELLPGATWTPDAGYVSDPALAASDLQRAAQACGGRFRFSTRVVAVERAGGRVRGVRLDDGTRIEAPVVVNVAGPHSGAVSALAGLAGTMRIGTRPLRHEVHVVPAPPVLDWGRTVVADVDSGVYFRPEVGDAILVGSTDPACDPLDWVDHPDEFSGSVTARQWDRQVLRLARRVPGLPVPHARRGTVGLYDVSDDWLPVYDRTDLDGFYLAIGTSGNQFKNAGVVGHCLAELIDAVEDGHDHDASPVVVQGRHTGARIDLGTFARNRPLSADSSRSVFG
jgi:sarcosine oxidase, subunit beta